MHTSPHFVSKSGQNTFNPEVLMNIFMVMVDADSLASKSASSYCSTTQSLTVMILHLKKRETRSSLKEQVDFGGQRVRVCAWNGVIEKKCHAC